MAAYWEVAAHWAYDVFSKYCIILYKYLIVNLVFPTSVFGVGISFWLRIFLIIAYLYLFVKARMCNKHLLILFELPLEIDTVWYHGHF